MLQPRARRRAGNMAARAAAYQVALLLRVCSCNVNRISSGEAQALVDDLKSRTGGQTVYMLQVPTDSLEVLDKGLQILEDWAHGVSFEPEEIDKERGVVVEEWRRGRGVRGAAARPATADHPARLALRRALAHR